MKSPPKNTCPEAVALRKAAVAFAKGAAGPVKDSEDRAGQRRNAALLEAALRYAEAALPKPVVVSASVKIAALAKIVGKAAIRSLRSGKAFLHVWRRTTPHNWYIGSRVDDGRYLWHSDNGAPSMLLSMFELVEDSNRKIDPHWIHGDGGKPESSIYRLKKEYRSHER